MTFRTSLIGLSALLHKAIVIVFSRDDVLQPSGIRRLKLLYTKRPCTSPTTVTGARRLSRHITAGCCIARGAHRPSWMGTPYARSPEPCTSPERPTGPKPTPPCSQRLRRRDRLRKLYEPQARLPVRPGERCRRRLDSTLSVSN